MCLQYKLQCITKYSSALNYDDSGLWWAEMRFFGWWDREKEE